MNWYDSWTLIHFLGWVVFTIWHRQPRLRDALWFAVVGGICWEFYEPLFGISEIWQNSFVTDMLANVAGCLVGYATLRWLRPKEDSEA